MASYRRPVFHCPFETTMNPHHDKAWEKTRKWAHATGLVQGEKAIRRLDRSGFSQLTACAYPHAGENELEIAISWMVWLFLFDDQLDECSLGHSVDDGQKVIEKIILLTASNPLPSSASPVEIAFSDLWSRYALELTQTQQPRFLLNIRNYLSSLLWEIENRATKVCHTPFTFAEIRRNTGAVRAVFDLIEYSWHAEIPPDMYHSAELEMLSNCAVDVICMSNDVFSYEKESARGEINNHVSVWQAFSRVSTQEAIDQVHSFVMERMEFFIKTKQKIKSKYKVLKLCQDDQLFMQRYIEGMEHWMRANLDFSLHTPRYADIEVSRNGQPVSWIENITSMPQDTFVAPAARK